MKRNKQIDSAVNDYTARIVSAIKEFKYTLDIDVDSEDAENVERTQKANSVLITSPFGIVTVLPDFKLNDAKAAVVKVGDLARLEKEGFDDNWISEYGNIYGMLLTRTDENVKNLAYYLAHKVDAAKYRSINKQ